MSSGPNVPVNQKQPDAQGQTARVYSCSNKISSADVQETNLCLDISAQKKPREFETKAWSLAAHSGLFTTCRLVLLCCITAVNLLKHCPDLSPFIVTHTTTGECEAYKQMSSIRYCTHKSRCLYFVHQGPIFIPYLWPYFLQTRCSRILRQLHKAMLGQKFLLQLFFASFKNYMKLK